MELDAANNFGSASLQGWLSGQAGGWPASPLLMPLSTASEFFRDAAGVQPALEAAEIADVGVAHFLERLANERRSSA